MFRQCHHRWVPCAGLAALVAAWLLPATALGLDPGEPYDYVIITPQVWVADWQPLADWKTLKGLPATIVTTEWIDANYAGNKAFVRIAAFIADAYATWGTTYVLLAGDTDTVACCTEGGPIHQFADNDTCFGDLNGDLTYEIYVGRASVRTTDHIATFISKTLAYEQDPPRTNFVKTAAFFGFDLHYAGDGIGQTVKENIRTQHLPADWLLHTEYDSDPGLHRDDVVTQLNWGHHLVNHVDHGEWSAIGVGSITHGTWLPASALAALTNAGRHSIMYSASCTSCAVAQEPCVGEAFVRNPGGGGVAYIGNTGPVLQTGDPDGTSFRFDRYFFRDLFDLGIYHLGETVAHLKHDAYVDTEEEYSWAQLTLLGDPELPVWTEDPKSLLVMYLAQVTAGGVNQFDVYVQTEGDPPEQATVCLHKDGEVYAVGHPDESGWASFYIAPLTTGWLDVTVTLHNYIPHRGGSPVVAGTLYYLSVKSTAGGHVDVDPPGTWFAPGTFVQLTAVPDGPNWCFWKWTGALTGHENPAYVSMTSNKSVKAWFLGIIEEEPFPIPLP